MVELPELSPPKDIQKKENTSEEMFPFITTLY